MVYRNTKTNNKKIHGGLLRDRISVHEVTKKPDSGAGAEYDVKEKFSCYAKVSFEQRDVVAGLDGSIDQNFENDEYKFIVRLMSKKITPKDFIRWRDNWFKVSSVSRLNPFEDFIVIQGRPANPNTNWDYEAFDSENNSLGANDKTGTDYLW